MCVYFDRIKPQGKSLNEICQLCICNGPMEFMKGAEIVALCVF
jgi:hypothetical protein